MGTFLDYLKSNEFLHFLLSNHVACHALVNLNTLPDNWFLTKWLEKGNHASMDWFFKHLDSRIHPKNLFPEFNSAIVCGYPYFHSSNEKHCNSNHLSLYCQGRDYHKVIHKSLKKISFHLQELFPDTQAKGFVDSGPISEKFIASHTPLGFIGKNSCFISPEFGSYLFLGILFLNQEINVANCSPKQLCGNCKACMEACPNNAIENGVLDARKCLSYLSIEDPIPALESRYLNREMLAGCDICQTVCPYNKTIKESDCTDFLTRFKTNLTDWFTTTEQEFDSLSKGSSIRRAGYKKFMENLILLVHGKYPEHMEELAVRQNYFKEYPGLHKLLFHLLKKTNKDS